MSEIQEKYIAWSKQVEGHAGTTCFDGGLRYFGKLRNDPYFTSLGNTHQFVRSLIGSDEEVNRLPVLDMKGTTGSTDYIDCIHGHQITGPVMRGIGDEYGRPFYVLHRCRLNKEYAEEFCDDEMVVLFQRYPSSATWTFAFPGTPMFNPKERSHTIDEGYFNSKALQDLMRFRDLAAELRGEAAKTIELLSETTLLPSVVVTIIKNYLSL